jgi:hypothetical protein
MNRAEAACEFIQPMVPPFYFQTIGDLLCPPPSAIVHQSIDHQRRLVSFLKTEGFTARKISRD